MIPERVRQIGEPLLFFILLGVIWEWSVHALDIRSYLLPPLSDVFVEMWESRASLLSHGMVTVVEVIVGFCGAVVLGVIIAGLIFYVPMLRRTLLPFITALQSVPKVALAPLMIVWFGYGPMSKYVMAFLFAFFPIVISTLGGLNGTPPNLVEHFRALRASAWETTWRLYLPAALPAFLDGCRIAIPLTMIGAIVGEFVGAQRGLGYVIMLTSSSGETDLMFAALITIALLSTALFGLFQIGARLVWWRAV